MPAKSKKKASNLGIVTERVKTIKRNNVVFLPLPNKVLKGLKLGQSGNLYLTVIDGVLQVSNMLPSLAISALVDPEAKFGDQIV